MSLQSAAEFFDQALSDTSLQKKIIAVAAAAEEPTEKADAVAKLGQSMGFEFTPAEAIELRAAARKSLIDQGTMSDELDELDLQAVTGGIAWDTTTLVSKAGGMAAGRMIPTAGIPGAGIAVSFFSAGVAGGIASAMNGGGAKGFFTGFGDGVVGQANSIANAVKDPIGTIKSVFSGW